MNVRIRVLSFLFLGVAVVPASAQVINGCVGQNGTLRIIIGTDACRNSETSISWNAVGPQGPPGPSSPPPSVIGTVKFDNGEPIDIYEGGAEFLNQIDVVGGGGGGGAGKVSFKDFTIAKKIDATSPVLFLKCANGTHFQKVIITLHRSSGDDAVIELGLAFVSDIQYGPSPAPLNSLEHVALVAGKVKVSADGASACWSVIDNRPTCP